MIRIKENKPYLLKTLPQGFNPNIFKGLSQEFIQTIFKISTINNYDANHILIRQGDTSPYIYLVIEGKLRTLRANINGDEATLRLLKKGDACMDTMVFTDEPSPISIQILENSKIMLIPNNFVRDNMINNAQFATNLIKIVTKHHKEAINQIDSISIKSPVQRVGYYLLEKYLEQESPFLSFQLPFKKSVIASHLNMTPETFSRALSQIKKIGLDVRGENIILQDTFKLCDFCDLDSAYICNKSNKEKCTTSCPNNYSTEKSACTG